MKKKLFWFFVAELFTVVSVVFIFKFIPERVHAGLVAGTLFISLGLLIVGHGWRTKALRKTATFYLGCIHLFVVAIPMVVTRLMNLNAQFADVRIWGLPGPVFHKVSTWIFFVLMLATIAELARAWRAENKKASA